MIPKTQNKYQLVRKLNPFDTAGESSSETDFGAADENH
jgi:hypothetical protein